MKVWITAILLACSLCLAQDAKKPSGVPTNDYTGMYSFLADGEFVRINIEDGSRLTGFISRRGNGGKPMFVDHFFEKGELHDRDIRFSTRAVNGVWFEFKGAVSRGPGKTRNVEDYYEIKGTLTEHFSPASHEVPTKTTEVTFRSLPSEICD